MKKFLSALVVATLSLSLVACGGSNDDTPGTTPPTEESKPEVDGEVVPEEPEAGDSGDVFAIMVTDMGGVSDQSFNQSAWEGLEAFDKDGNGKTKYIESATVNDITTNLGKATEEKPAVVWGIGFLFNDPLLDEALVNPDTNYAIVDSAFGDETPENVTGVMFKAHEPSFLVGYMAARTTKSGVVGFVGGIEGEIISQFDYGYKAGVEYANKAHDINVEVLTQYVNDFSDESAAKGIANQMFSKKADIVFHAAGQAGLGVIAAAEETGNLAIGVDRDQSNVSDCVMTSALKLVSKAVYDISLELKNGTDIGGKTYWFGLAEDAVGIPPYAGNTEKHVDEDVYNDTVSLIDIIKDETIVVPANEAEFKSFKEGL